MQTRGLLSRKYELQPVKIIAYSVMLSWVSFVFAFWLMSNKTDLYKTVLSCEEWNLKASWIQLAMVLKNGNVPLSEAKKTAEKIFSKTPIRFDEQWLETMISDTDKIYGNPTYYQEKTSEQLSDIYKECVVTAIQEENSSFTFLRGR